MTGITNLASGKTTPINPDGTVGARETQMLPGEALPAYWTRIGYNSDGTPKSADQQAAGDKQAAVSSSALGRAQAGAGGTIATSTDFSNQKLG